MVPVPIPDMPDAAGVGVAQRPETVVLPLPQSVVRVWRIAKTRKCLHCGELIGVRAALGALYCSEEHQHADLEQIQQAMADRLKQSRARLVAFQRLQCAPCLEELQS
jgi:hypothetical protein